MKRVELVFIPSPGMGHLVSAIQFSKRLLDRDDRFSVTILSIKRGDVTKADAYIASIAGSDSRLKFIHLPHVDPDPPPQQKPVEKDNTHRIQSQNDLVKEAILNHVLPTTIPLAGLVVDMFNSSMIDVAHELGVPSYVFFTCNAAFLGFMLYLPTRHDQVGIPFRESDPDSVIASYVNPVPSSVLPSFALESSIVVKGHGYLPMVNHGRKFKEVDGIIVNTFYELETHAVNSFLDDKTPPVYTVGPVIDLENKNHSGVNQVKYEEIMKWLDDQPPSSVVFLCFGSWGTFSVPQLKEIALGLERSGHRFLWSIRLRTSNDRFAPLTDSPNLEEILPPGFLERTREVGMICGWAPQVEVLAHKAIGGFVTHCGWNSILESVWYGVPMAAWPMYAEQQLNAFQIVRDLGLAVELKLDYRRDGELVMAEKIEQSVKCLMEPDIEARKRVKEMSEKSRKAVMEGGSSHASLGRLIEALSVAVGK
ncbi:hypothetical protein F2P56_001200 [Juglans regia]|uniref:Glycosyltransferase n=2 Tax=Juglans regia TaxID=51240 RepID=A0A833XYP5_JUGRE|nr:anthocyanidin 3-O-glucosyltransferase 2-like [Juglans regia]KAF5480452.1 hypothetical protein F2P56_001200 [Juglans regia]